MEHIKTKIEANSLEEILLKPLDNHKTEVLTELEARGYLGLCLMSEEDVDEAYDDLAKSIWSLKVWEKRVESALTIKIHKKVLMFLSIRVLGNVGSGIMYIYYLQYWAKKNGNKRISLDILFSKVFPNGFFPKEEMHKLWDAQKIVGYNGTDNMIDIPEALRSVRF